MHEIRTDFSVSLIYASIGSATPIIYAMSRKLNEAYQLRIAHK